MVANLDAEGLQAAQGRLLTLLEGATPAESGTSSTEAVAGSTITAVTLSHAEYGELPTILSYGESANA